ncbi:MULTISPECIES: LacI family DNA-binding transcriptional regulator [unclassified Pseudoalteromonas]|uniref:LacI family DNA-binding transcriptional regulator n=1 Tax=unclassified Pseudoalteromonas TaxID=194690 RepID=UPI0015FD9983|nr:MULTISPECIES: LacI family DNA-binding transcriptional regulator [unclassified Pseudoalteromonas]MBB1355212.1 LacI family DNA-binding transcriptional regulator [Pseudoalteromonas sp. SR45-5]MBH0026309.1 LacI family DNA-binding transcriptional regulator [Pseudoalteromonas sp. SWN29]
MITNNWLHVLKDEVERQGMRLVAEKLGVSKATVSQVLNNKYKASTHVIQQRVEGVYMAFTVDCPILGDIAVNQCLEHQNRKFAATNHIRVALYKACRNGCSNSKLCGSK